VSGGVPPYTYSWNNLSATTAVVFNLPAGVYIDTVSDANGCKQVDVVTIQQDNLPMPSQPMVDLCAVTVDSMTGNNLVIWEKIGVRHASLYKVYREGVIAGQYNLVGSNVSSLFSTFLDASSVPLQQSYRYKISETDSCGNEFALSNYHKTIHLTANLGVNSEVNLIWNQYEGKPYTTHYIMRSDNGNPFVMIAQVSSSTTSYSDLTPPVGQKIYRIDIDMPTFCSPTAKVTSYSSISSNSISIGVNGVDDFSGSSTYIVPNPITTFIRIIGEVPAQVKVTDASGKLVLEEQKKSELSLAKLASGVYLIKLYNKEGRMYHYQKIVKQ
jgi:hypothetical protein